MNHKIGYLVLAGLLVIGGIGCDWETTDDDDDWDDSYSWVNLNGVYRNPNGGYIVSAFGSDESINSSQSLGVGNGARITFSGTLTHTPIVKGSVSVSDTVQTFTDADGDGNFSSTTAGGNGSINYETGTIEVTFTLAPSTGQNVNVTYQYWKAGAEPGSSGTQIYTLTVEQEGQKLRFTDSDGATYAGKIGKITSSAGGIQEAASGTVTANFSVEGTSKAGRSVTITGTFSMSYSRETEDTGGTGGTSSGSTVTAVLSGRRIDGTWVEGTGISGDVVGVAADIEVDVTL